MAIEDWIQYHGGQRSAEGEVQNSYAANARVLSAVKDMLETLMRM